jgi:glycosyltransferase involved in cell wall biosynthesis
MSELLVMMCDVDLDVPDGARTHTVEVARGFARAGLSVKLLARGSDPRQEGVEFFAGRGEESDRVLRVASINARAIGILWRQRHRSKRFYVRHKWSTMPAAVIARCLGYRVVSEVDDVPYGRGYEGEISPLVDYFKRFTTFLMGRLSNGVVAGTEEARDLLAEQFRVPRERIGVVPIGVDIDYFHPLDRAQAIQRAGLDPAGTYIVFVGQFAPWVDFDTLIGAFALVSQTRADARLLLVGDGAERPRIEASLERLGIAERVTITGFIRDRDRLRDLLASATVAVASHRGEHLNRIGMNATKLAEYLASGRAIVAKDVARLRAMLEETGAGIVVAGEPQAMAAGLEAALEPETADRLGATGRRLAVERYSWDATVTRTLPLFGL